LTRLDDMARRLPPLYRDGELVRGLLAVAGVQLDTFDDDAREVQRAHWFDSALEPEEVTRLAALLGLERAPWQDAGYFRAWVHATRDAMVRRGAVTPRAIREFVADYAERYQQAAGRRVLPPIRWDGAAIGERAVLRENPPRRREQRPTAPGRPGLAPLERFTLTNRGLDDTTLELTIVGLPQGPEHVPVIVNVTTGDGLIYQGRIAPGQRLWTGVAADGHAAARLEGADVSAHLRSVAGVTPGTPWPRTAVSQPARPLRLVRGDNVCWFLPLAHYDQAGLDRFLFAMPDLEMGNGYFDATSFDHALFHLPPAVQLHASWIEHTPASFRVELPGGTLLHPPGQRAAAEEERARLVGSLDETIGRLRAAGVASEVELRPFREVQGQGDVLRGIQPLVHRERGPTGVDSPPVPEGAFTLTELDGSTFQ